MKALVTSPICPLMVRPSHQCERADEALFGYVVEISPQAFVPDWFQVTTHYRYMGYAHGSHLLVGDGNIQRWEALPKQVVTHASCDILAAPSVQSWVLVSLPRGSIVSPIGTPSYGGWQRVSLPDGSEGYTKATYLGALHTKLPFETYADLRLALVSTAHSFLGTHYRWGGKTPQGIDCSGFTSMCYLLNGIIIYRDAQIKKGFPVRTISYETAEAGDLLFFPGHVALYLGEDRIIHATAHNGSDGVVLNSLNPLDSDYRGDLHKTLTAVGSIF